MNSKDFVEANEVFIKTDRIQGNMVILKESEEDTQYFLMFVGDAEITAIAKEKGLVEPKRPLTHDLYLAILNHAGVVFDRIEIHEMQENTYYAKVYATIQGKKLISTVAPVMRSPWHSIRNAPFWSIANCSAGK